MDDVFNTLKISPEERRQVRESFAERAQGDVSELVSDEKKRLSPMARFVTREEEMRDPDCNLPPSVEDASDGISVSSSIRSDGKGNLPFVVFTRYRDQTARKMRDMQRQIDDLKETIGWLLKDMSSKSTAAVETPMSEASSRVDQTLIRVAAAEPVEKVAATTRATPKRESTIRGNTQAKNRWSVIED
jgi:uncharacterized protein YeeX (DUF496 family)